MELEDQTNLEVDIATDQMLEDLEMQDIFDRELDELVNDQDELSASKQLIDDAIASNTPLDIITMELFENRIREINSRRKLNLPIRFRIDKESDEYSQLDNQSKVEISMEGVGDFIKGVWDKVKSAIKAVFKYLKDFWVKHFATLNLTIKSIEKLKERVSKVEGGPSGKDVKAPKGLQKAFKSNNSLSSREIDTIGERQSKAMSAVISVVESTTSFIKTIDANALRSIVQEGNMDQMEKMDDPSKYFSDNVYKESQAFGKKEEPLVEGFYGVVGTKDGDDLSVDVKITWEQEKHDLDKDKLIVIGSTGELTRLCDNTIKLLKHTQQLGSVVEKVTKDFDKAMNDLDTLVGKIPDETPAEGRKYINNYIKQFRDLIRLIPKVSSKITTLNIKFAKQTSNFIKLSLKNYSSS